jgi:RsiW-degrading membrane proteinase PrsW (M82 family)
MTQHSVFNEPQFNGSGESPLSGGDSVRDEFAIVDALPVGQCVRDEPTTDTVLAGSPPAGSRTYAGWLQDGMARTSATKSWLVVVGLVLISGLWSVMGAVLNQVTVTSAGWLLLAVVVGPVSEEMMKASATLMTIEKWPYIFRSPFQIILCCLAAAAGFSALENLIYLHIYIQDASQVIVIWRWTVCMVMHCGSSLIVSLGLVRIWRQVMDTGASPRVSLATTYIIAGAALHGSYNLIAVLISPFLQSNVFLP